MPSEVNKPCIYINPFFNIPQKNNIHINPNVQLNVAIHVNPKMVNALSATQLSQLNQQKFYNQQQTQQINGQSSHIKSIPKAPSVSNLPSSGSKLNVQKSVYINPKLMQQLKSVPDVQKSPITPISPKFISKRTLVSKNKIINSNTIVNYDNNRNVLVNNANKRIFINSSNKNLNNISNKSWKNTNKSINNLTTNSITIKKSSPSLVSISKRKLIRIKPATKLSLNNSPVLKKSPVLVKKSPMKLHNLEGVKRTTLCSPITKSFKLNNLAATKKITSPGTKSLKLNNLNKYKKINVRPVASTSTSRVKSAIGMSSGNKYKIDRTKTEKKKATVRKRVVRCKPRSTNTNLIKIDGVMYKSSKSQLVKSSPSSQSTISKKFNTVNVNRNSLNNSRSKNIYRQIKSNSKIVNLKSISTKVIFNKDSATTTTLLQRSNYKHFLSNRAKQKSIQILRHKMSKNNQPCLLFQRFGFCAKFNEGTCPKVHDKKQVALCKNFLQGNCLVDNCRLSHDVGPEKMPTCKYFLDGCCVRDSCQYLHVKVSANTPICIPFLQGYCEKGDKCKQRHTNICPEFEKTEKCSKGKNCPYPHKSSTSAQKLKVYNKKKCKATITFSTQTGVDNEKSDAYSSSNLLPIRDDNKKRYYDNDDCLDETLAAKRIKIITKINTMKYVMSGSEQNHPSVALDSSVVTHNNAHQQSDKSSQPDSQNLQFKRPPIGPLPAYIPI
ncbi:Similar to ZC3H3: Zinc finger CCCH domain-containing protein 3 (Drosophila melanogaster) [Cotesia congregata]|uniref:Similar to ZC3H3: Zinc finger CCCH domain-containing protein 3 (Drosophila melanogaster) n=1 Tax=Cotesia congregata TaxID=51543 RepID=A0A8J2HPW7_COTCN|nr:Similar to ZC3H3: Zinc finger CCCH domain-containing protein 3 (Drosophila melanogaster) [Cotesia congregata]